MTASTERIAEKQLQRQIAEAKDLLNNTPRAKLVFSVLPDKPFGLNGSTRAYQFNQEGFLRMCVLYRDTWVEVMPTHVTRGQREALKTALGFDPEIHEEKVIPPQAAYLPEKRYFVDNK